MCFATLEPKHLQGKRVDETATEKLVKKIHVALGSTVSTKVLEKTFKSQWRKLDAALKPILDPSIEDYNNIIDDFIEVFLDVNKYRASLNFTSEVDRAIKLVGGQEEENNKGMVMDGVYKKIVEDKVVDDVYKEIEKRRKPFIKKESKLVGNVSNFFRENFMKEDLRITVSKLSPILWSDSPFEAKHEKLLKRIKNKESEVYLHYHQILLDKLRARIGEK
jgi:hypothetical protein